MSNPKYRKGRDFENQVRRYLETRGYTVTRSAGSKGASDLIASNDRACVHIQCKHSRRVNADALLAVIQLNIPIHCIAAVAKIGNHGQIVIEFGSSPHL